MQEEKVKREKYKGKTYKVKDKFTHLLSLCLSVLCAS